MMPGIAFVQRRGGELVAAVVAQNPLLLLLWQARIGDGHIEPSCAVAAISPRAVVGGVRITGRLKAGGGITPGGCLGMGGRFRSPTKSGAPAHSLASASTSSLGAGG